VPISAANVLFELEDVLSRSSIALTESMGVARTAAVKKGIVNAEDFFELLFPFTKIVLLLTIKDF